MYINYIAIATTEFLFLALYFLKIALLSANQSEEIFSCILIILLLQQWRFQMADILALK